MAAVNETLAGLRLGGDSLVPEDVTRLLGHSPTLARTKGQEVGRTNTGSVLVANTGQWHLSASNQSPGDFDAQVEEILSKLSQDFSIWHSLTSQFKADMFCGLFCEESDEGISISAKSLAALGNRGIELALCIYSKRTETPNKSLERTRDG